MDCLKAVQAYVDKAITHTRGIKVLLLDADTVSPARREHRQTWTPCDLTLQTFYRPRSSPLLRPSPTSCRTRSTSPTGSTTPHGMRSRPRALARTAPMRAQHTRRLPPEASAESSDYHT